MRLTGNKRLQARMCSPYRIGSHGEPLPSIAHKIFLIILSLATASISHPQSEQSHDPPIKLSAELVVVDVLVLDKKTGRALRDLKKEDFSIYEDGVKQQITHFSQDKLPLSVVLLLDTSGSVWRFIKQTRGAALQALKHLKADDEVALIATASKTELIQDFTKDKQLIADKIEKLNEKALGRVGILLHEAIYQAAVHMRKASTPFSRRVIIVVTDDISTQWPFIGHSEKEAIYEVFETGSVVCGLLIGRWEIEKYIPTRLLFSKIFGSINTYADRTGGVVLQGKGEDIGTKLAELIEHLRTRYALGYVPSNTARDGKFRKIKVTVSPDVEKSRGKLAILARRGYYARRDDNAADNRSTPPKLPHRK